MAGVDVTEYVFDHRAEGMYALVTEMLNYIRKQSGAGESCLVKAKAVFVEMLTNAVKHCNAQETILQLEVTAERLLIHKRDRGGPLTLITRSRTLSWPLPGRHYFGEQMEIYGESTCKLSVTLQSNCHAEFYATEHDGAEALIAELPEHFGLMIITRASESFNYHFDIDSCTNTFTAKIALQA